MSDTMGRISYSCSAEDAVETSGLVIEAIVENLAVKQKLFSSLDKVAPS